MLKKRIAGLLAAALVLPALSLNASAVGEIGAASAIVIEPRTGAVLYEKDPDRRMLIASTTKIMTALVVLEHCALSETVGGDDH